MRRSVLVVLYILFCAAPASAATVVSRAVVGSGVVDGSSAHHAMRGTVGQTASDESAAGTLLVRAGFWIPLTPVPDSVDPPEPPTAFALHPGAPNPFTEECVLRYDVPAGGGWIRLRIFDVRGRLVRELVDGGESPGIKTIRWSGRDDAGRSVGFGLYFVMLEAPGYRSFEKVLRIR